MLIVIKYNIYGINIYQKLINHTSPVRQGGTFMNLNFTVPTLKVDTSAIEATGKTVREALNSGNKLNATLKLSNYKIKTTLGRELPEELRPEVIQHVTMMRQNGWMTEADEQWCQENHI